jgi:translation initiation factor IF-2
MIRAALRERTWAGLQSSVRNVSLVRTGLALAPEPSFAMGCSRGLASAPPKGSRKPNRPQGQSKPNTSRPEGSESREFKPRGGKHKPGNQNKQQQPPRPRTARQEASAPPPPPPRDGASLLAALRSRARAKLDSSAQGTTDSVRPGSGILASLIARKKEPSPAGNAPMPVSDAPAASSRRPLIDTAAFLKLREALSPRGNSMRSRGSSSETTTPKDGTPSQTTETPAVVTTSTQGQGGDVVGDLFDYQKEVTRRTLEDATMQQEIQSYRPKGKDKISFKKMLSTIRKRYSATIEEHRLKRQATLSDAASEDRRPVLEITGRVPVTAIAKAMSSPMAVVLDHLEAVGEDLTRLAETAREYGEEAATVDPDAAEFVVKELGGRTVRSDFRDRTPVERPSLEDARARGLPIRVPLVTVMGHVDHGKTTLLDFLRKASVAAGEAGGITQTISAFVVSVDSEAGIDKGARAKKGGKAKKQSSKPLSAFSRALTDSTGCLTFLDTPGHQLFSSMRQRGTAVTDAVVLVVAGEDGVMPQTKECVELLMKLPDVPVVVAVTKVDRLMETERDKAMERVAKQLADLGMVTELEGGDIPIVGVSGVTGEGVEDLKELLLFQCEVLELRTDFDAMGEAAVLDSKVVKGLGFVADCVVQWGTLKVGQPFVVGHVAGRVRGLIDDAGVRHDSVRAGLPVRVMGLEEPPPAGARLLVVESEDAAKDIATRRRRALDMEAALGRARESAMQAEAFAAQRREEQSKQKKIESLHRRAAQRRKLLSDKEPIPEWLAEQPWEVTLRAELVADAEALARGDTTKKDSVMVAKGHQQVIPMAEEGKSVIPVILRADMRGSVEALKSALEAFPQDHVQLRIVREDVGAPTAADLEFAQATDALVLVFGVSMPSDIQRRAEMEGIRVMQGRVIYSLLQDVADSLARYLPESTVEKQVGVAEVLSTFPITSRRAVASTAAGCRVMDGALDVASHVRVMRGGELIFEAKELSALKRFKDDVRKVEKGQECGVALAGFSDYQLGDRIVLWTHEAVKQKLDISYLGVTEADARA